LLNPEDTTGKLAKGPVNQYLKRSGLNELGPEERTKRSPWNGLINTGDMR
jgi:hypothetical protein